MITLKSDRQKTEAVKNIFFPYLALCKNTRLKNVAHNNLMSEPVLHGLAINCLTDEIELIIKKKLINTTGSTITFKFSNAQGIVLYRALLMLPIPKKEDYLIMTRNLWLDLIEQELIRENIWYAGQGLEYGKKVATGDELDYIMAQFEE